MTKPAFQPAPRPRPATTPDDARRLTDSAKDLGFGRASTSDAPEPGQAGKRPFAPVAPVTKTATVKLDVPDAVYVALRQEALRRRVTVKYLILEALAEKGYEVDLASVPEDGRRVR